MSTYRPALITLIVLAAATGAAGLVSPAPVEAQQHDEARFRTDAPIEVRQTRGVGIDGRFYEDRERGWFWFEEDPELKPVPPPDPVPVPEGGPGASENPHQPFSVEWLRIELEKSRILAIDEPTRENIEYYGFLEKIAMDKAERFSMMRMQVRHISPGLDETVENPVTTLARTARRDHRDSEQAKIIGELAKEVGIYYFFKSDCPYCLQQNMILQMFAEQYGFSILPISIDARPMPDGIFPNWVPDNGQARFLAIESTPTLYLVRPPNEVTILSVGVQTFPALEQRVLQVAHGAEWIDQETFDRAMRGLPRRFLADAIEDVEGVDWSDRTQALEAFRHLSRRGVERTTLDELSIFESSATKLLQ